MLHCGQSVGFPTRMGHWLRAFIILNRSCQATYPIVHLLREKEGEMHIRIKSYGHFLSICRSLRDLMSPHDQSVPTETSPSLVFATTVSALLLTIPEIDLHRAELHLVGLMHETDALNPSFMSP
jgi:hypothetical protein